MFLIANLFQIFLDDCDVNEFFGLLRFHFFLMHESAVSESNVSFLSQKNV